MASVTISVWIPISFRPAVGEKPQNRVGKTADADLETGPVLGNEIGDESRDLLVRLRRRR